MIKTSVLILAFGLLLFNAKGQESPPELIVQAGHMFEIEISPDNRLIASLDERADGISYLILWEMASGRVLRVFPSSSRIGSVEFSPDSKFLVGQIDGIVKLLDISNGNVLKTVEIGGEDFAYSPDGKKIAFTYRGSHIWDLASDQTVEVDAGLFAMGGANQFSPDNKLVACIFGGSVGVFDAHDGKLIKTVELDRDEKTNFESVIFSPDGSTLAVWVNNNVNILDIKTGDKLKVLKVSYPSKEFLNKNAELLKSDRELFLAKFNELKSKEFSFNAVKFTANNELVTILQNETGDSARLLNVSRNEEITVPSPYLGHWKFSDNGKLVFLTTYEISAYKLTVYDGETFARLKTQSSVTQQPAFVHDNGKMLCVITEGGKAVFWDLRNGHHLELEETTDFTDCDFNQDGNFVAFSRGISKKTERIIEIWDLRTKQKVSSFEAKADFLFEGFSPDNKTIAIWEITEESGQSIKLFDVLSGKELRTLAHSLSRIGDPDFDSNWKFFAYFDVSDRTARVLNVEKGNILYEFPSEYRENGVESDLGRVVFGSQSIKFSPDNKKLLVATTEGLMRVFDLGSGKLVSEIKTKPDYIMWSTQNFSSDGQNLTVKGGSPPVDYWHITTGRKIKTENSKEPSLKKGERGSVEILSPDGNLLGSLYSLMDKGWLFVTPQGFFDGTPNAFKQLIWRFDNNTFNYAPVEAFFKEFYRPGLLQEIMSGKVIEPPKTDLASVDIRQAEVRIAAVDGQKIEAGSFGQPAKVAETITKREVEVALEVTDNTKAKRRPNHNSSSGANDLRLFRGGSLVKKWPENVFDKASGCEQVQVKPGEPRKAICRAKVAFTTGDNELSAYAFNSQNVKSTDATAVVKGADSLKKDGTLYIFAVGVDKYAATDPQAGRRHDLQYAVADVNKIGEELAKQQIDIKKYARTEVIKLTDQNATKENILLALKHFSSDGDATAIPEPIRAELSKIKRSQPEDAILFHFSGHGTARCQYIDGRKNCDRFYLVPHDGFPVMSIEDATYNDKLFAASISDEELERAFEPIDAGNLLMVIDACNSGQALESEEQRRGPMNSRGLAQLAYEKGMMILTASQSQQLAIEDTKYGHGLLTYSLLKGLKEAEQNDQKSIIDRSWFNYASAAVPNLQLEAMKTREATIQTGAAPGTKGAKLFAAPGDNPNLPPEKRGLQSPRLFYRREANDNPFVVARLDD